MQSSMESAFGRIPPIQQGSLTDPTLSIRSISLSSATRSRQYPRHVGVGVRVEGADARGAAEEDFLAFVDAAVPDGFFAERFPDHGAVVEWVGGNRLAGGICGFGLGERGPGSGGSIRVDGIARAKSAE